ILHALREGQVSAEDRRAVFVGIEAYEATGGTIIRNLFDDEEEGFLTDAALLNRLVRDKLQQVAAEVVTEGWKWVAVEPAFDYQLRAGMRRLRPIERELSDEDQARLDQLASEYDAVAEEDDGENSQEVATRLQSLEAEIASITGGENYRAEDIAIAGAFVAL